MATNPFLKEHAGPLVGSAFLHALAATAALFLAWYTATPKLPPPAAIEAYVAARPAPQPAAPPPALAPPAEQPVAPPAPVPDPRLAEKAAEEARLHKAEELSIAEHNRQVDLQRRPAPQVAPPTEPPPNPTPH